MSDPAPERTPMTNDAERVSDIVKPVAWRWHVGRGWNYTDTKPSFEPRELPRVTGPVPLYTADIIEAQSKALAEAREALKPFSDFAGELFARNWNASDVVLALDNPDDPHRVTGADFFAARRATPTPENPNG